MYKKYNVDFEVELPKFQLYKSSVVCNIIRLVAFRGGRTLVLKNILRHILVTFGYVLMCTLGWLAYYVTEDPQFAQLQGLVLFLYTLALIGMIFKSHKILSENYEKTKISMKIKSHNYEKLKGPMKNIYTVGTVFIAVLYGLLSDETISKVSTVVGGGGYTYIVIATLVTYLLMLMAVFFSTLESSIEQNL